MLSPLLRHSYSSRVFQIINPCGVAPRVIPPPSTTVDFYGPSRRELIRRTNKNVLFTSNAFNSSSNPVDATKKEVDPKKIHPFDVIIDSSGTLLIVGRGDGEDGIVTGGDGIYWVDNNPVSYNNEKVFTVGKVVVAAGGVNLLAHHIIDKLNEQNFKSAYECAEFTKEFMAKNPYLSLLENRPVSDIFKVVKVMLAKGLKYFNGFLLVFSSADELALYNGYQDKVLREFVLAGKITSVGMFSDIAEVSIAASRAAGLSTEMCIVKAFAAASRAIEPDKKVGGRIIIKKVNLQGVEVIFDGDINDMLLKYNL